MEIIFDVPPERVPLMLEMLRSMSFVSNVRPRRSRKSAQDEADTTAYLNASPANAERLRQAYEQFDRGERVSFELPNE
ncbi:hypothetical protein EJV47_06340 [Hymenobacter gummosus]|uniref:Uncharacterized protein n=1 Tax=Hymenobacter gummosus TaxID=1776032 RepID=A0A3S0HPP2_9BACT|nr:hypothetical protein [Hymenobacter gummosus]RTQ51419.1 hypothetical protein EJV47_06340 [Hymenobacter gummosus]